MSQAKELFPAAPGAEVPVLAMQASSLAPNAGLAQDLVQATIERALRNQEPSSPGTRPRARPMRRLRAPPAPVAAPAAAARGSRLSAQGRATDARTRRPPALGHRRRGRDTPSGR